MSLVEAEIAAAADAARGSLNAISVGTEGVQATTIPPRSPQPDSLEAYRARRNDTLDFLHEEFPLTFVDLRLKPGARPALKLGIHRDLAVRASAITPSEVHEALVYYCGAWGYLRSLKEGAPRLDLDGMQAGVVTAEEAARAQIHVEAIRSKVKARREAEAAMSRATPEPPIEPAKTQVSPRRATISLPRERNSRPGPVAAEPDANFRPVSRQCRREREFNQQNVR